MLSKQDIDKEIVNFISTVQSSPNACEWKFFTFLADDSPLTQGMINYEIKNLNNTFGLHFLDRVTIEDPSNKDNSPLYGTVIGEYNGKLYINFDVNFYSTKISDNNFFVTKNEDGKTNFQSIEHFKELGLGFYLSLHNDYYERTEGIFLRREERKNKLTSFFQNENPLKLNRDAMLLQAEMHQKIIERVQLYLKTIDSIKNNNIINGIINNNIITHITNTNIINNNVITHKI